MQWFFEALRNYKDFSGRARRSEYWFFTLFHMLLLIGCVLMALVSDLSEEATILFVGAYLLLMFLPSWSVAVRRLHDTGRSGWWLLIGGIPLGGLVLFVFNLQDSEIESNQYGRSPKYEVVYAEAE
ncbi:MAG: DUF805 domain-containing protein [Rhodothermales bacterium]